MTKSEILKETLFLHDFIKRLSVFIDSLQSCGKEYISVSELRKMLQKGFPETFICADPFFIGGSLEESDFVPFHLLFNIHVVVSANEKGERCTKQLKEYFEKKRSCSFSVYRKLKRTVSAYTEISSLLKAVSDLSSLVYAPLIEEASSTKDCLVMISVEEGIH